MTEATKPGRDAGQLANRAQPVGDQAVPTGNTYDKYSASNPVVKRLMVGFERDLLDLLERTQPRSIIDVGCGEGVLTEKWAARMPERRVVGVDLEDPKLKQQWKQRVRPNLEFRVGYGHQLPYADNEFEAAAAMEVLEHVPDPEAVLNEMARVASRWILASVPREPLWRALNMARGAYLRDLGNTPGHLNHWSKRGFAGLLSRYGRLVELRSPLPWTMALVELGSA
jgi:2-polyprenyl-3-methyl-5-hydroxy-6-metoxy-1,4-benzoquinol methylase